MINHSTIIQQTERIEEIEIDLIDVPDKNPRGAMNDDHVIELSGNIGRNGLLQPIGVKELPNGRYELIWGFHRLAAVMRFNWKKIMANIKSNNGHSSTILSLCENLIRKQMSLEEEIEAVGRLTREEKMSPSMICDFLNRSKSWVDLRLSLPGFPQRIKDALFDGLISIDKAQLIARVESEGARNTVLNQVIYGKFTRSQTQELVELYLSNPTLETAIQEGIQAANQIQSPTQILKTCAACGATKPQEQLAITWICANGCQENK